MKVSGDIDATGVLAGLGMLAGPLREKLLRSGLVAAGKVVRDEAEMRVPVKSGRLKSAIYLAYSPERSVNGQQVYGVSWRKTFFGGARHGHLIEFGHWQPYQVVMKADGSFVTRKDRPLPEPKFIPAKPFLRPAMDAAGGRAVEAATERMRVRLPELLAEAKRGT
jgi:hypothetical protein